MPSYRRISEHTGSDDIDVRRGNRPWFLFEHVSCRVGNLSPLWHNQNMRYSGCMNVVNREKIEAMDVAVRDKSQA